MSRATCPSRSPRLSFPRVSGDEPFEDIPLSREEMFSPRERG